MSTRARVARGRGDQKSGAFERDRRRKRTFLFAKLAKTFFCYGLCGCQQPQRLSQIAAKFRLGGVGGG